MSRFDVIIVGGGPAGAWAGHRLARGGAHVALLDGSHPREKPCGGGITGRALEIVWPALTGTSLASVEIDGATFIQGDRQSRVPLGCASSRLPQLVVAGRREFDGALLAAAVASGVEHKPLRATGIHGNEREWTVATRNGSYSAPWLLGADGANSFVRRQVFRAFDRADLSIAAGYFVRGCSSREIEVAFEQDPPGYLWSFPRPDHLAVGVCAQADEATSNGLLAIAAKWIDSCVGSDATLDRYSWPIPSLDESALARERPSGTRWMLLGDAAGLVDPITREGIFFALKSADFAADALLSGQDAATIYSKRVAEEIFSELARAARLKARFFRPQFTGLLVEALDRSERIRAIMADLVAGRQPYRGLRRRLLKTLELRLMVELFGY
jgi:geranylgeranyl diphosphate/geranylgeranyl-bacteriochlorophyllide a reductase